MTLHFFTGAKLHAISEAISVLPKLETYSVFTEFKTNAANHGADPFLERLRKYMLPRPHWRGNHRARSSSWPSNQIHRNWSTCHSWSGLYFEGKFFSR